MVDSKKNEIEVEYEVGEIIAMELEEGVIEEVAKDNLVGTHDNHTSHSTLPSNTPRPPNMPPKSIFKMQLVNGHCAMGRKERYPLTPHSSPGINTEVRAKLGANIGFDNPLSSSISQNLIRSSSRGNSTNLQHGHMVSEKQG